MNKIFLLILISISVITATAQTMKNSAYNMQVVSSQHASNAVSSDGFIENITVYPNPVVDDLKISFRSSKGAIAVVLLFNNIGKQIFKQEADVEQGNNIISIDIRSRSIEPGVYFVQLFSENQIITRKIIVK